MQIWLNYLDQILIFAAFALSLNLLLGYAGQVSVAHAAFGVDRVAARASRSENMGGQATMVQFESVIEAGAQYRRRPSAILRCAQHQDVDLDNELRSLRWPEHQGPHEKGRGHHHHLGEGE